MSQNPTAKEKHPLRPEGLDLSKLSTEELNQLRADIFERARRTVDPRGIGFDAVMLTDDGSFFQTDDVTFKDWWDWVTQLTDVVSKAARGVGLGIISGGWAIASSHMFASDATSGYGKFALGVSVIFGAWFVVTTVQSGMRRR